MFCQMDDFAGQANARFACFTRYNMACLPSGSTFRVLCINTAFPEKSAVRIKRFGREASGVLMKRNRSRKVFYVPVCFLHSFLKWI